MKLFALARLSKKLWSTYWFVPGIMVATAIGLSFLLPYLDHLAGGKPGIVPGWIYAGGPEGARVVLSTIASSMITVAALTFSITIAALSTASAQFGPRLLSNFIRDRGYQVVLGTFLAGFVYCLLVLRTVRSTEASEFVPYLSLAIGIAFAIAGVVVLVYFIHHAAFSIRAESIVASTGQELGRAIDQLFSTPAGSSAAVAFGDVLPQGFPEGAGTIPARHSGYLVALDNDRLARLAHERNLILKLEHRPGHFITADEHLLDVWPDVPLDQDFLDEVADCIVLGPQRPSAENIEAGIDQLVEIALRALSPGINDPDTALACIDQLAGALARAGRQIQPPGFVLCEGKIRLVTYPLTYARLVDASFSRIRQYGRGSVPVLLRLLEVIVALSHQAHTEGPKTALLRQARMIKRAAEDSIPDPEDRALIDARFQAAERALATVSPSAVA